MNEISVYYDFELSSLKTRTLKEDGNVLGAKEQNLMMQKIKSVTANSKKVTIPITASKNIYIVVNNCQQMDCQ